MRIRTSSRSRSLPRLGSKKAGFTRSGQLSGYRLLRGDTASTERTYLLELEGLMSLTAGIADAIRSASAGAIAEGTYDKVRGR